MRAEGSPFQAPVKAEPPVKLLYFITEDWFFCSHFRNRAQAAREAGYAVTLLTHVNEREACIRELGIDLIPLALSRRSLNPWRELRTFLAILRVYRQQRPQLVHHFALKPILYGTLAARLAGIPHCVNAPLGMGFVYSSSSLLARILRPLLSLALRFLLNPPNSRVIFENADDRRAAIQQGLVRAEQAVLMPGAGVEVQRFQPQPVSPCAVPAVVLVARMLWEKGIGTFVEAARRLRAQNLRARFLVVGAPDEENPAAIPKTQLEAWDRAGLIEWLGYRTDIPEILSHAQIFCLPSAYGEGLPKAILEAMAAGLPVVTTDVPGCREAVRHGENGLLVPSRDPRALAKALARLLRDPACCRRMGQRGRWRAEREFSSTRICAATLRLYEDLLTT